ncbi:MAG: regulatory protein GemA [Rhodobacteraceae bacterium]|nr:regulatory protein GemA [Paracoccaceae bacterium]
MTDRSLQRKVFMGCRALGLDDDMRRDLQEQVTGKSSMREMSEADLKALLNVLENRGFKPAPNPNWKPTAERPDLRYIHALWGKLGRAGQVTPGRRALNAFIRKRFGASWGHVPVDIDAMREADQIAAVLEALKAMCRRAGLKVTK